MATLLAAVLLAGLVGGCGLFDDVDLGVDGVRASWVTVEGQNGRRVIVAWPAGHSNTDPRQKLPVVIILHGLGSDAESMARMAEWPTAVRDRDFVAVFADGYENSWNAGGCCGAAKDAGENDVAFLDAIVDQVVAEQGVDPSRIYLTGYSNGAMMTYRYLCERPDRLAGAASVSGTDWSGCKQSAAVPFMQVSGADDPVVPVKGGPSSMPGVGNVPKVETSVLGVALGAGCGPAKATTLGKVKVTRAEGCRNGATVRFDVVDGLDHSYPSGAVRPGYVAVDRILDFWGIARKETAATSPAAAGGNATSTPSSPTTTVP